ncbi:MAG: hypothetical protein KAH32_01945 [Chlamydiia bacterium]|nr:hypothetical protein [Chlamydiia bacterium]
MLKSGDCFYKSYLEEDLSRAFVINYVIIFTVFPYNSEEMLLYNRTRKQSYINQKR